MIREAERDACAERAVRLHAGRGPAGRARPLRRRDVRAVVPLGRSAARRRIRPSDAHAGRHRRAHRRHHAPRRRRRAARRRSTSSSAPTSAPFAAPEEARSRTGRPRTKDDVFTAAGLRGPEAESRLPPARVHERIEDDVVASVLLALVGGAAPLRRPARGVRAGAAAAAPARRRRTVASRERRRPIRLADLAELVGERRVVGLGQSLDRVLRRFERVLGHEHRQRIVLAFGADRGLDAGVLQELLSSSASAGSPATATCTILAIAAPMIRAARRP